MIGGKRKKSVSGTNNKETYHDCKADEDAAMQNMLNDSAAKTKTKAKVKSHQETKRKKKKNKSRKKNESKIKMSFISKRTARFRRITSRQRNRNRSMVKSASDAKLIAMWTNKQIRRC